MTPTNVIDEVQAKYGAVAVSGLSGAHGGVAAVAAAFGYSAEELASIPAGANMGLSCGNPTATAHLKPGEVVVDLGCGGGIDVLLAAGKVGPTGKAIGIDMTPEMLQRARDNARAYGKGTLPANVEFLPGTIDNIPLPAASVDCLISNCVINLAPDKQAVFRDMFRVLKPGGRVAVSDIALKQALPPELGTSLEAYIGCIAGTIPIRDYEEGLRAAGFTGVQVVDTRKDLNAYAQVEGQSGCCSPPMEVSSGLPMSGSCCGPTATSEIHSGLSALLAKYNVNDYAASVQVYALKPKE